MGKHSRTAADETTPRQSRESVAENLGTAYWSVVDRGWPTVQPGLPGYMVDLLAPPIVVGTAPVVPTSRLSFPGSAAPVPARSRPLPSQGPLPSQSPSQGQNPVPIPATRLRPAGAPLVLASSSQGRHRRPGGTA